MSIDKVKIKKLEKDQKVMKIITGLEYLPGNNIFRGLDMSSLSREGYRIARSTFSVC